ncbi:hypothetical protein CWI36_0354p0010 [Hamiltosporidium magnivora]|uniref:Uncharacterized protein n=1 Tax=Hamiltosporidium magnivora TaxID=148818 RepID=A0A4Q9LI85_9MICR|nr:hypothetical protein CWI36_0354p0010 [Hamiltosporidium magnivora]
MRIVCYFDKKNTFLFYIFIVVCLSSRILSSHYNIDEYRDLFVKKSLDLYYKKTKGLASLPRAVDYTFLFCYDSQIEAFANVLSNNLQGKPSNNYEININIPNSKSTGNNERIKLKLFSINRKNNNTWSISSINSKNNYQKKIQSKCHIFAFKNNFKIFLDKLFRIHKCIGVITRRFNNFNNHFVSIEDTGKGISKKIPKRYLSDSIDIWLNSKNGVWIKVFSESENFDKNIDKDKMIEIFKTTHREMLCFSHLTYTLYIIDRIDLELNDGTYRKKVLKRSIINRYMISFHSTLPNITNETRVSFLEKTFKYNSYFFVTEFEYLYSSRKSDDPEYKFKLLLKFSSFTFGFNFNWYITKHPFKRYDPDSLYYIYVIAGKISDILKILPNSTRNFFRIERAITIVSYSNFDNIGDFQNPDRNFTLQQLFDYLVFKR